MERRRARVGEALAFAKKQSAAESRQNDAAASAAASSAASSAASPTSASRPAALAREGVRRATRRAEIEAGVEVLEGHRDAVVALAFAPISRGRRRDAKPIAPTTIEPRKTTTTTTTTTPVRTPGPS